MSGTPMASSRSKTAQKKARQPWEKRMPEKQFTFMSKILAAPSPIGFEAAMSYGVLKPFFEEEATESVGHATVVRDQIVKLGGVARTDRDDTEIVHTTDYKVMLEEAMKTERHAAETYRALLDLPGIEAELYDAIEQIYFMEERSVEELNQLM